MIEMDAVTLDQFRTFVAIAEDGSFAAAARRMNRVQSAVTYAIQKLEEQTGILLFDRSSYRPKLTEAGKALLPRARRILDDVADYSLLARGLGGGLEAEVSLVVDPFVPTELVVDTLKVFSATFPMTQIRMSIEPVDAAVPALSKGWADLAVVSDYIALTTDLERNACGWVTLVAVAAPNHPLALLAGPVGPEILCDHVQLVLSARSALQKVRDLGVVGTNRWYLSDIETKHAMLLAGLGWGSMPRHRVSEDLRAGRLVELKPSRWDGRDRMPRFPFVVARRKDKPLGTAGRWLVEQLTKK